MPNNYILLEKIVVGSAGASSVTFANIPQTGYTDLVVKMSARDTASASAWYTLKLQFNSDTTDGNYSTRIVYGFGSTAGSGTANRQNTGYITSAARTANTFNNLEMYIPNYAGSTYKSFSTDVVTEGNGSSFEILGLYAGLWSSTAAITQIVLAPDADNFAANSTFYLYGVAALGTTPAIAPKATGGDVIDTDGTYWYHIFRSSGTFTPATSLTCDYLVVAGGGGAAGFNTGGGTGGGGAGGLRSTVTATGGGGSLESPLSLASSTGYTVTIGAGGAGGNNVSGNKGSDSVFSTITSEGGGLSTRTASGGSGGSGGGGYGYPSGTYTGGAGTTNQGFAGGNGNTDGSTWTASAGGGGAGAVATNVSLANGNGTAGGAGVATSISGSSVTYAGGGGGGTAKSGSTAGTGGAGGGGAGGILNANGTNGTANTGGGGGGMGGGSASTGGSGGSGIVIVRYLVA